MCFTAVNGPQGAGEESPAPPRADRGLEPELLDQIISRVVRGWTNSRSAPILRDTEPTHPNTEPNNGLHQSDPRTGSEG